MSIGNKKEKLTVRANTSRTNYGNLNISLSNMTTVSAKYAKKSWLFSNKSNIKKDYQKRHANYDKKLQNWTNRQ